MPKTLDVQTLYKSYLNDVKLMQLATSVNNKPWLCNVWYVMDDDNNIYFTSRKTRRHSQEIEQNANVSCTFHKWFNEGLGQKGQAVIVAGTAQQVPSAQAETAYNLYLNRYPALADMQSLEDTLSGAGDHYFYKITPNEIIWWDEVNFPEDAKQHA